MISVLGVITSFALESPKSNTLLIMVLSSSSRTPSSWLTFTMVFSSAAVMRGTFSPGIQPNRRVRNPVTTFSTATTGLKIVTQKLMTLHTISATFSAFCAATVFGVISPKIRIMIVMMMVAIPAPLSASPPNI